MWKNITLCVYFVWLSVLRIQTEASNIERKQYEDPVWRYVKGQGLVANCHWGYRLHDDNICADIDECAEHSSLCGPTQLCTNVFGGYTCSCRPGLRYVGPHLCEDIDECASAGKESKCSQNADCVNTVGSYECKCHEGFRADPKNAQVCVDVDECAEIRRQPLCQHHCNNTIGSYKCSCHSGYQLNPDNSTCSEIDKCKMTTCQKHCINTGNSYYCTYPLEDKTTEDHMSCTDINECDTCGQAMCGANMLCENLPEGFMCSCLPGHRLINQTYCEDIDECAPGASMTHYCSSNADCVNTIGSYQCRCKSGFRSALIRDTVCVDIDECAESPSGSLCQQRCINVWGGYHCSCFFGYALKPDNRTCSDTDKYQELKTEIHCVVSTNDPDTYHCTCPSGYKLSDDKKLCLHR